MYDNIHPNGLILGKALGGSILPVSVFLARKGIMEVFTPASHGSTFGGNSLAGAIALEVINILEEELIDCAVQRIAYVLETLEEIEPYFKQELIIKGVLE